MNIKTANLIAQHRSFYLGKIEAPGNFYIPFLLDIKRLYSYPTNLKILAQELGKLIVPLSIDRIAGIETASIPLATAVSLQFNIPLVYVRKKRKKYGTKGFIEGAFNSGDKVVLIDDVIGPGIATKQIYGNCLKEGVKVDDMVLVAHDPIPKKWAKQKRLKFHQLLTIFELWEYLYRKRILTKKIYEMILDWRNNLMDWQKEQERWSRYLNLIKKEAPDLIYPF